jgi:hypothetical protein
MLPIKEEVGWDRTSQEVLEKRKYISLQLGFEQQTDKSVDSPHCWTHNSGFQRYEMNTTKIEWWFMKKERFRSVCLFLCLFHRYGLKREWLYWQTLNQTTTLLTCISDCTVRIPVTTLSIWTDSSHFDSVNQGELQNCTLK